MSVFGSEPYYYNDIVFHIKKERKKKLYLFKKILISTTLP